MQISDTLKLAARLQLVDNMKNCKIDHTERRTAIEQHNSNNHNESHELSWHPKAQTPSVYLDRKHQRCQSVRRWKSSCSSDRYHRLIASLYTGWIWNKPPPPQSKLAATKTKCLQVSWDVPSDCKRQPQDPIVGSFLNWNMRVANSERKRWTN